MVPINATVPLSFEEDLFGRNENKTDSHNDGAGDGGQPVPEGGLQAKGKPMKGPFGRILASLALSIVCGASMTAAERRTLHMEVHEVAARLERIERLPATNRLRLAVGLPLHNQDALTDLFHQLYNPASTNFHRFLRPEQFTAQFGPTEQEYQSVIDYARSNLLQVVGTFSNRALLDVEGNVGDIEGLLQIHLGVYQHPRENRRFFAPDTEPSVDSGLPILYVSGLDNYVVPQPLGHVTPEDGNLPEGGSDPTNTNLYLGSDFRNAYAPGTTLTGAGQVVGLVELGGYNASDIQAYESYAKLPSVPLNNVMGSLPVGKSNLEVALDIEMAIAMAPGLSAVNVYEATNPVDIFNRIAYPPKGEVRPNQVSCSWGGFMTGDHASAIIPALIQMAVQGQSLLQASGDSGAFLNGVDNTGLGPYFNYVTDVGGTKLQMNGPGTSWKSETVWNDSPGTNFNYITTKFASTGGILPTVGIPDYQENVSMALNNGSTQYRNVPDVAMVAKDIRVVTTAVPTNGPPVPGKFGFAYGTSAAAPLWAGFVALANQQAAAQGKPSLGFLNPALYDIASGPLYATCFHDITNGNNTWIDNGTTSGTNNYYAVPGYDLCTGWGTPAGTALIDALVGLSGPVFVDFNYLGSIEDGTYERPFKTLAGGTNAVSPGGTILIKTAGSSSETMIISKPMTISASDRAATIGH